jgi:hypothetical protein
VAQEYLGGETLHGLAKRHDISRNLIRIWVAKYEAGVNADTRLWIGGHEDAHFGKRRCGGFSDWGG